MEQIKIKDKKIIIYYSVISVVEIALIVVLSAGAKPFTPGLTVPHYATNLGFNSSMNAKAVGYLTMGTNLINIKLSAK